MKRRQFFGLVVASVVLVGCSAAPSDRVLKSMADVVQAGGTNKASWCFRTVVPTPWGLATHTWQRAGEGVRKLSCDDAGMRVGAE